MDQEVGVARPGRARGMVLTPALRSRPERRRAVVGDVGDRRVAVADPVAEGAAALVRDLPRLDREALGLEGARGQRSRTSSRRAGRLARWGSTAATSSGPAAPRHPRPRPGRAAASVTRASRGRPPRRTAALHVVPVQMGEEDRPRKGRPPSSAVTCRRPVPASRMSVGGGGAVIVGDGDTRGVPAVADEVAPGAGVDPGPRRSGPAPAQSRAASSRRCPSDSSSRCERSSWLGVDQGDPAGGHRDELEVRRRPRGGPARRAGPRVRTRPAARRRARPGPPRRGPGRPRCRARPG